ncbi:MAG: methionine--tRNA ligase [candidate division Zixibacteria bacterium]|nr:methionine--tRNA ligase [candidate division Zixibacteria bacterium]
MVTTPIYYVNDKPHIGQAYTTVAADVLARFHRAGGEETFFLTGTDEHGSKVEETAKSLGKTPRELCDLNVEHFKKAWKSLDISYDYFVRTTDARHEKAVEKLLSLLYKATAENGEKVIYAGEYTGLYCVGCEKFITEKELVDGLCPDHLQPPKKVTEKNYFFRLSSYLKQVEKLIREDKLSISPEERKKETLGLFKQGLEDFSISREKVAWGIPLPFDPKQNAYVWVDALPNYISAVGYGDDSEQFKRWWKEGRVVHLIGKDILKFHAIFWPGILLASKENPPDQIFIHGFFTIDGQKMSKTLRNVISPEFLVNRYGPDGTRYLLLTQFPFGQDGDIQVGRFAEKYNADLANDLGNLVSRTLKMVRSYCQGEIPAPSAYERPDEQLKKEATECADTVWRHVQEISINQAIDQIIKLVRSTNKYVENQAPWALAKSGKTERLNTVLYVSCETLRIISVLFDPVLPRKCRRIRELLGLTGAELNPTLDKARAWGLLKAGTEVGTPESLFPRLEKKVKAEKVKTVTVESEHVSEVSFEEFSKIDLRVAEVKEAERVKGADKLLKLKIDIGSEERQIVAGIAEEYSPEQMIGKKIVVVVNLKPARIKGIESKGMLLAAKDGKTLSLVGLDKDLNGGAEVS